MRRHSERNCLLALAAAATLAVAMPTAHAAADNSLSPAQSALFDSNHLKNIPRPETIAYAFRHEEPNAAPVEDRIKLEIREVRDDGKKNVWVDFLSGDRHVDFEPAMGFNGNPLLMFVLDRDVAEMRRVTGGSTTYFRNRIREAFADRATVGQTTITVDGQDRPATRITLQPFLNDPMIDRFKEFREKSYDFILSDAVPGTLYRIATRVPAADGGTARMESVTYAGVKP
jgi:hypothetical protein